jgi:micrococcal nuclease
MKMTYPVPEVFEVIDGDTIDIRLDLGFDVMIRARIRLLGVQAPEIKGKTRTAGLAARDWLAGAIYRNRASLKIIPNKSRDDKYGRILWTLICDKGNINQALVLEGHAVPLSYE